MKEKKTGQEEKPQEQATAKLRELLHCGNERVELSAAKEILAKIAEEEKDEPNNIELQVTIRVVGE